MSEKLGAVCPRLVDYLTIVGNNSVPHRQHGIQQPQLLARYPPTDHKVNLQFMGPYYFTLVLVVPKSSDNNIQNSITDPLTLKCIIVLLLGQNSLNSEFIDVLIGLFWKCSQQLNQLSDYFYSLNFLIDFDSWIYLKILVVQYPFPLEIKSKWSW